MSGDRCQSCGGKVIVHGNPAEVGQTGWYQPVFDSAAKSPCDVCGRGKVHHTGGFTDMIPPTAGKQEAGKECRAKYHADADHDHCQRPPQKEDRP